MTDRLVIPVRLSCSLRQLIIYLDHVDAPIRIFDPSYDVEGIRQKIPTATHRTVRGDLREKKKLLASIGEKSVSPIGRQRAFSSISFVSR